MPTNEYPTMMMKIMKDEDLSYGIVSKMTGLSKSAVYNYSYGYRQPDISTACKIIRALQLDISSIETLFLPVKFAS